MRTNSVNKQLYKKKKKIITLLLKKKKKKLQLSDIFKITN